MGVKGYGKEPKSIPVGSETVIDMYPLDFEEFLWANGVAAPVIDMLRHCLQKEVPVPEALHNRMKQLLLQYAVVGGMPDAVKTNPACDLFVMAACIGKSNGNQLILLRLSEPAEKIIEFLQCITQNANA